MYSDQKSAVILILQALQKYSGPEAPVSMKEIQEYCLENGKKLDRRTISRNMEEMKNAGIGIHQIRFHEKQGYVIDHHFSASEAFILINAINENAALDRKTSSILIGKVASLLSEKQAESLPPFPQENKSENTEVLRILTLFLKAVHDHSYVEFLYYDLDIARKRKYRHEGKPYKLVPFALVSQEGRYYVVFYSDKHENFANYRIDKMDQVKITREKLMKQVVFDLDSHMRTSFKMYHGDAQTVTAKFRLDMSSIVFDTFSTDILISDSDAQSFTASIRTAVTPTLKSWFLQFYDRAEVIAPLSLKEDLIHIASAVIQTYNNK